MWILEYTRCNAWFCCFCAIVVTCLGFIVVFESPSPFNAASVGVIGGANALVLFWNDARWSGSLGASLRCVPQAVPVEAHSRSVRYRLQEGRLHFFLHVVQYIYCIIYWKSCVQVFDRVWRLRFCCLICRYRFRSLVRVWTLPAGLGLLHLHCKQARHGAFFVLDKRKLRLATFTVLRGQDMCVAWARGLCVLYRGVCGRSCRFVHAHCVILASCLIPCRQMCRTIGSLFVPNLLSAVAADLRRTGTKLSETKNMTAGVPSVTRSGGYVVNTWK